MQYLFFHCPLQASCLVIRVIKNRVRKLVLPTHHRQQGSHVMSFPQLEIAVSSHE